MRASRSTNAEGGGECEANVIEFCRLTYMFSGQQFMSDLRYCWSVGGSEHSMAMVFVEGTGGRPFLFGEGERRPIEIRDFFMATVPVTQALWSHVMVVA
jgi:hypothetical protein